MFTKFPNAMLKVASINYLMALLVLMSLNQWCVELYNLCLRIWSTRVCMPKMEGTFTSRSSIATGS